MIKKVLIATDGSSHARKAVAFGSDIAAKYGAEVVLVHILLRAEVPENLRRMAEVEHLAAEGGKPLAEAFAPVAGGRFPTDFVMPSEKATIPDKVLWAIAEQIVNEAETSARKQGAAKVSKRIEDGDPVREILDIVEAEGIDLVVSGSRGLSDLKALLVGSVSHKLTQLSPVTCICVR